MTDSIFPREVRLLTAGDFRRVFDQADFKAHGGQLMVLARENDLGHPRVGLVVAKKVVKRAVGRNRIKRIVRESFRHKQHDMPAIDCVVMARNGISDLDNADLRKLVDQLWTRLRKKRNGGAGSQ